VYIHDKINAYFLLFSFYNIYEVFILKWVLMSCAISKTIDCSTFIKFLEDLASQKKIPVDELTEKLVTCGLPGTTKTTQAVNVGGVDRLTDTSQYTGTHKERFDKEGKGKGISGREDVAENSGYVGAYKGKDTYDKSH
jgi:hypothetical protein